MSSGFIHTRNFCPVCVICSVIFLIHLAHTVSPCHSLLGGPRTNSWQATICLTFPCLADEPQLVSEMCQ